MDSKSLRNCADALDKLEKIAVSHAEIRSSPEYNNIMAMFAGIIAGQQAILLHMSHCQEAAEREQDALKGVVALIEREANGGRNDA